MENYEITDFAVRPSNLDVSIESETPAEYKQHGRTD